MKVTKETTENCEVILTVEIDDAQKQKLLQKAARRISKNVRIPGFRPGKAPYNLVLSRFGIDAIQEEATKDLTTTVFQSALEEAEVTPYAMASLDKIEWEPLVMTVKVPTDPVVELGDYRSIRLEVEDVEVTDDEIDHQLEHLREHYTTYSPVERPAEMGDLVSVSVSEKTISAGEAEPENWDEDIEMEEAVEKDGEPDFVAHLLGKVAGEEVVFTHTFADDYDDDEVSGETIEYTLKINAVKVKEEFPLDDDFASLVGDYDSLDDLKAKIKEDIIAQKQRERDSALSDEALEQIAESAETIKWPQVLEERELDHAVANQEARLKQYGLDLTTFLKSQQKTLETFREELRESVKENLKTSLVLSKIVELEDLAVDNAELSQEADMMVMLSGGSKQAQDTFKSPTGLRVLTNNLLTEKALRRLLAIVKGEADQEPEPAAEAPAQEAVETEPVAEAGSAVETVAEEASDVPPADVA